MDHRMFAWKLAKLGSYTHVVRNILKKRLKSMCLIGLKLRIICARTLAPFRIYASNCQPIL